MASTTDRKNSCKMVIFDKASLLRTLSNGSVTIDEFPTLLTASVEELAKSLSAYLYLKGNQEDGQSEGTNAPTHTICVTHEDVPDGYRLSPSIWKGKGEDTKVAFTERHPDVLEEGDSDLRLLLRQSCKAKIDRSLLLRSSDSGIEASVKEVSPTSWEIEVRSGASSRLPSEASSESKKTVMSLREDYLSPTQAVCRRFDQLRTAVLERLEGFDPTPGDVVDLVLLLGTTAENRYQIGVKVPPRFGVNVEFVDTKGGSIRANVANGIGEQLQKAKNLFRGLERKDPTDADKSIRMILGADQMERDGYRVRCVSVGPPTEKDDRYSYQFDVEITWLGLKRKEGDVDDGREGKKPKTEEEEKDQNKADDETFAE